MTKATSFSQLMVTRDCIASALSPTGGSNTMEKWRDRPHAAIRHACVRRNAYVPLSDGCGQETPQNRLGFLRLVAMHAVSGALEDLELSKAGGQRGLDFLCADDWRDRVVGTGKHERRTADFRQTRT